MIINTLTLKNFKSHKNTKINFNENISLILGKNGAGKSSILEAISYCLFKEYNGKKLDNIIRKSKEEDDAVKEMYVILEFKHDNIQYKIQRGKKGKKSFAKLWQNINGIYKIKYEMDKDVTRDIAKILNLDSKSFLNAVYIKQGEITDLIDKSPAERKELISKLLNIDSFEIAWNEIKQLQDIYKQKISNIENDLKRKKIIEEDNKKITENIEDNKETLNKITPEINELEKLLKEEEHELSNLENSKSKYDNLVDKRKMIESILNSRIKDKEEKNKKLEKIKNDEKEISSLEKDVKKLPFLEELKETKEKFDKNQEDIKKYEKDIGEIEKNSNTKEETRESHELLKNITKELEELKSEKIKLNEKYLNYQKIDTKISEKSKKLEVIRKELQKASKDATDLFKEFFDSPESIERKVLDEREKVDTYIKNLTKQINENENKISALSNEYKSTEKSLKELEHTEGTCPICQSEISQEKHEELSNRYTENLGEISSKIDDYEESNKSQNNVLKDKEEYLNAINSISIDVLKEKNNEFKNLSSEIKTLKNNIEEYSDVIDLIADNDIKIKEKEDTVKNLQEDDKKFFFAEKRLKELGNKEELNKKIGELNQENKIYKATCQEIVVKYAVGDDLIPQIKHLKDKETRLNILRGSVQDKESLTNEIENITNEITSNTNKLNELDNEINSIEYDEDIYQNKSKTYTSNKEKSKEKNELKIQLETVIIKDKENITKNDKELEILEEKEIKLNNLKDYYNLLEKLREIYSKDGVQKDLRENVKPFIEKETVDIFNNFDFDYTDMTLNENYEIKLYNKNEELTTDMISGGEKIVVALALRLGIAKVLSQKTTDLLILDEPTIHLDEDRCNSLIKIIQEINFVPQMLVVTHDEEMETLSNNIIKIKKENGISSIDNS